MTCKHSIYSIVNVRLWIIAVTAWLGAAATAQYERPNWLKPGVQWPVEATTIELQNPADFALRQHPVIIDLHELNRPNARHWVVTTADGVRLPAQADDLNRDGTKDELALLADFEPGQSRRVFIYPFRSADPPAMPLKKRVHARLALNGEVPKQEITAEDGDMYRQAQHHGPAWESELIAYRVYFDKKSTIDIYGKRTHQLELELERTKWYTSSELRENGFGQDIVHVGATLGVGSVRGWDGDAPVLMTPVESRTARVLADGPVRTVVEIAANGWRSPSGKRNVTS